jgi:hypothetical protein
MEAGTGKGDGMKPGDIVVSSLTGRRYRVARCQRLEVIDMDDGETIAADPENFEPEDPAATRAIEEREARDERDFQAGKDDAWED